MIGIHIRDEEIDCPSLEELKEDVKYGRNSFFKKEIIENKRYCSCEECEYNRYIHNYVFSNYTKEEVFKYILTTKTAYDWNYSVVEILEEEYSQEFDKYVKGYIKNEKSNYQIVSEFIEYCLKKGKYESEFVEACLNLEDLNNDLLINVLSKYYLLRESSNFVTQLKDKGKLEFLLTKYEESYNFFHIELEDREQVIDEIIKYECGGEKYLEEYFETYVKEEWELLFFINYNKYSKLIINNLDKIKNAGVYSTLGGFLKTNLKVESDEDKHKVNKFFGKSEEVYNTEQLKIALDNPVYNIEYICKAVFEKEITAGYSKEELRDKIFAQLDYNMDYNFYISPLYKKVFEYYNGKPKISILNEMYDNLKEKYTEEKFKQYHYYLLYFHNLDQSNYYVLQQLSIRQNILGFGIMKSSLLECLREELKPKEEYILANSYYEFYADEILNSYPEYYTKEEIESILNKMATYLEMVEYPIELKYQYLLFASALEEDERALKIVEKYPNITNSIDEIYNEMLVYLNNGKIEEAKKRYEQYKEKLEAKEELQSDVAKYDRPFQIFNKLVELYLYKEVQNKEEVIEELLKLHGEIMEEVGGENDNDYEYTNLEEYIYDFLIDLKEYELVEKLYSKQRAEIAARVKVASTPLDWNNRKYLFSLYILNKEKCLELLKEMYKPEDEATCLEVEKSRDHYKEMILFLENSCINNKQWFNVYFTSYARPCNIIKCNVLGHNKIFDKSVDYKF